MHDYKDNFSNAIDFAIKKTKLKWWKLIFLGIMGCIYVGIAYIAFINVIAGMQDPLVFADGWEERLLIGGVAPHIDLTGWPLIVGAAIFPVGLLLIIFLGGSLFTSDNLTSIAILTKQVKIPPVFLKWCLTLLGNLIGAFMIAALARGSNIFNDKQLFVLQQIISKKVHLEWWQAFFSGILCNILVAGTVWSTMATKHSIAKIFLIYFPIWLFAIVGFQHVTANSIIFAFGWTHADSPIIQTIGQGVFDAPISLADWSFRSVFINMIPAMCGNWLSGAIFLPFVYFWLSDHHKIIKLQKKLEKEGREEEFEDLKYEMLNEHKTKHKIKEKPKDKQKEKLKEVSKEMPKPKKVDRKTAALELEREKTRESMLYGKASNRVKLSENEIPRFDEFYDINEDNSPADSLIKTLENDFSMEPDIDDDEE